MVFKCIASVRTETIDSDARRSLEDALRSVTGDGLPSRCPEPTDDAPPQQPPRPSHSTKNMRFKREGKGNFKGTLQRQSHVSMTAPPKMTCSRSSSFPCNLETISAQLKRSQCIQSAENPYHLSCDTIQSLKVAPMHHEAHLAFPFPYEGFDRGSEMDKAGQYCVKHLPVYSSGSLHPQDTVFEQMRADICSLDRADSYCRSSFTLETNSFSCRDGYGVQKEKESLNESGGNCSVMMWLPHRCINLAHLLRSGLTKLDNNMRSSFKTNASQLPKGTSKETSPDETTKVKNASKA